MVNKVGFKIFPKVRCHLVLIAVYCCLHVRAATWE